MYTPNEYIIQTIRSNVPYNRREDAIAALNAFEGHRIGQQITLLYRNSEVENNISDVHCLIAMGIKNANECGASGAYSPDRWENKYYPNGPHGTEFYRIIADSAERNEQGYIIDREVPPSGDPDPQEIINSLSTTKVDMVGNQYTVLNPVRQEEQVEDPFQFKRLNGDDI